MNEKIKSPSAQSGAGGAGPPPSSGPHSGPGGSGNGSSSTTPPNSVVGAGGSNNGGGNSGGPSNAGGGPPPPPNNNGSDLQQAAPPHPHYGPPGGGDPSISPYHHIHQQPPHPQQQHLPPHQQGPGGPPPPPNTGEHPNKDEYGQSPLGGPPPPPPGSHHPVYGRYHHPDPNMDPYRYGHAPMQQPPVGGKPQQQAGGPLTGPGSISSPGRPPPQRYIPGQPPQGPTPTLNSLLQSSHPPPPPQHRYSNSYDPQQQQQQQPPSQQHPQAAQQQPQPGGAQAAGPHGPPPPPPHQPYGTQQGVWAPPPRPYSPQMGPSQAYRTPPPTNTSRGQSPYPPAHGQNSGSYPPSSPQQQQQQPGGPPPPPPQSSNQGTAAGQYSPYPQRYPTPPGPATGPNHRTAYSTHQYPEPNRPWPPGGSSPAPSPGPAGSAGAGGHPPHPHPPASPHQSHQQQQQPPPPHGSGGPPPPPPSSSSPGHAPSPSPQPSQASPSPHQELIGQNSNDSSSGGGHSGMGSGPPGTPNSQQVMRPTPSPTGSSGSRSMSPAVAQNHPISRPSSNQSSSGGPMQQQPGGPPPPLPMHMTQSGGVQQQQQSLHQPHQQAGPGGPHHNSSPAAGNSTQQVGPTGTAVGAQQPQGPPHQQSVNSMPTPPPQGAYPPPPPHMHGGYKMVGPGQNPGPGGYPPPPQQTQQYSQGSYPPRPQYPPSSYAPTPPPTSQPLSQSNNNLPPGGPQQPQQQQYPGRPMPNHSGSSPHTQYPPYQNWVPPSPQSGAPVGAGANMGNHIQGKATPPPVGPPGPGGPTQAGSGSPRPLNYLKQHLQHKGGVGYGSGTTPPQGYGNGPGMHPGMSMAMGPPPHHMGPPHGPTSMGPPASTPPQSLVGAASGLPGEVINPEHISQDNGISSSGSSTASGPHPVTSVVTTGPDGTPIDEVSQQSTLSNASAASGEDPQCTTPKSRKNDPYSQSHLAPPSTSPSNVGHPVGHPGGGVPGEEYEMNSPPNWTRTPASPVFNSHVPPQESFRTSTKKSDSLCKLYEMDDNPERRGWLDKLRAFMEERRTPITACPTISKQPLDLYRLYIYVKERGGFVEVTKSKTWKDIAGLLGIGASSSAAYTLRKHYTKNLLAFECHFDRGDIDPLPIIQQVEAGTKKKSTKAASVPSPGSSNSQDSFPAPGNAAANASLDGYPGYPGGYPGAAGPQPDYGAGAQMQRPPSQSNAQTPHGVVNSQSSAATGAGGVDNNINVSNPFDEPPAVPGGQQQTSQPPSSLPPPAPSNQTQSQVQPPPSPSQARAPYQQANSYPPVLRAPGQPYPGQSGAYGQYGSGEQYNASGPPGQFGQGQGQGFPPQNRSMYPPYGPEGEAPPPGANQYGPYGNRPYSQPPPGGAQTPTPPGAAGANVPPPGGPTPPGGAYPPGAPAQQDYYRPPDQPPQQRRHPDFVKDTQPYPGYNARPQIYGGWQGGSNQYRGQYPSSPSPQSWGGAPPRTAAPPGGPLGPPGQQTSAAQWDQHRYPPQQAPPPPQQQPPYPPQQQSQQQQSQQQQQQPPPQWATQMSNSQPPQPGAPPSPLRPPLGNNSQQQQRMPSGVAPGMPTSTQQQPSGAPPVTQGMAPGSPLSKPPFSMPPPPAATGSGTAGSAVPGTQCAPPGVPGSMAPSASTMSVGMIGHGSSQQKPPSAPTAPPQMSGGAASATTAPQATAFPPSISATQLAKKEITFPPDSVEATTPVLYRRKRLTKSDVCPVDPWRIFMALRSGLLTECTWALDVLNVLLFDDTTVQYFGLAHLPELLTILLEHFQKHLYEMFSEDEDSDDESKPSRKSRSLRSICSSNRKRHYENNDDRQLSRARVKSNGKALAENKTENVNMEIDEGIELGQVREIPNPEERLLLLSHTPNYTMMSRKGMPVRMQTSEDDIFVTDDPKPWDIDTNKLYEQTIPIDSSPWTYGLTDHDSYDGIIDVFKSEIIDIPFSRYIRSKKHNVSSKENLPDVADDKLKKTGAVDIMAVKKEITENDLDSGAVSIDDEEAEQGRLQQTFNKKRRLFNNNASNINKSTISASNSDESPGGVKKVKLQNEEPPTFVQPEAIKKDQTLADTALPASTLPINSSSTTDSDCREVDMEIETAPFQRLANGNSNSSNIWDPKTTIRDPAHVLQRRRKSTVEEECYTRDEASLYLVNESQDSLARRCICLSNIFRNLTFVPGNETILAKSTRFLAILGRLLLLNHEHLQRTPKTRNYDREEDTDFTDSCSSLQGDQEWWWDYLISIRENMLVSMANIAGHLELSRYEEIIARPLIDGLLHWAVCPSAHGQDPFPSCGPNTSLSPQRLALEALCKLCVTDANVDLVIATPPYSRLEKLCAVLTRHLCRNEDQVLREFSVNLLHYLAAADSAMARTVALQSPCISYLVAFIEQAESTALGVANQHGINYLRENPDSMGTSLDMLRRAAGTLLHLAKHPDNRSLFMQQEQRLIGLVMSHILDQQVALVISRVLFQVSRGQGPMPSSEYRQQLRQQNELMLNERRSNLHASERKHISHRSTNQSIKPELCHELTANAVDATCNADVVMNKSSIDIKPTPLTNSINAVPTTVATADENSNSSNQSHLQPAAALNDVSNSSTNSNSCSTAISSHSNMSNISSNVSNSSHAIKVMNDTTLGVHDLHNKLQSTTAPVTGNVCTNNNSNSNNISLNNNICGNNNSTSNVTCTMSTNAAASTDMDMTTTRTLSPPPTTHLLAPPSTAQAAAVAAVGAPTSASTPATTTAAVA